MMKHVIIFSDGSSLGNPGPGGYGTILRYTDPNGQVHEMELYQGYRLTTNNRMELMGAIAGLEALNFPCQVDLYSDSQYVVKAFADHWVDGWLKSDFKHGAVKNIDLWKRLLEAKKPHQVTFHWVKGHAGHAENERCDALAKKGASALILLDDPGVDLG